MAWEKKTGKNMCLWFSQLPNKPVKSFHLAWINIFCINSLAPYAHCPRTHCAWAESSTRLGRPSACELATSFRRVALRGGLVGEVGFFSVGYVHNQAYFGGFLQIDYPTFNRYNYWYIFFSTSQRTPGRGAPKVSYTPVRCFDPHRDNAWRKTPFKLWFWFWA